MSIGQFKYQASVGRKFNSKNNDDGIEWLGGEELVAMALSNASSLVHGHEDVTQAELKCLAEIVGRLVDYLAPQQALDACGLQYTLEVAR